MLPFGLHLARAQALSCPWGFCDLHNAGCYFPPTPGDASLQDSLPTSWTPPPSPALASPVHTKEQIKMIFDRCKEQHLLSPGSCDSASGPAHSANLQKPSCLWAAGGWAREVRVNRNEEAPQTAFAQGLVLMSLSLMSCPCN